MRVLTSAWNPQSVQTLARVWRAGVIGAKKTDHDLTVDVYSDYNTATADATRTWTSSTLSASLERVQVHLTNQKVSAIQIRLTDATPTGGTVGTGEGLRLAGVSLEVGLRGGLPRLPAAQKG
jgi:hypothetical protein